MVTRMPATLPAPLPIAPTEDVWRAMTPDERMRFVVKANDALKARRDPMAEKLDRVIHMPEETARLIDRIESLEMRILQAEARAVVAGLREAVLALLDARGIACPDDARALLMAADDPSTVRRWLSRAATVGSAVEVFSPGAH